MLSNPFLEKEKSFEHPEFIRILLDNSENLTPDIGVEALSKTKYKCNICEDHGEFGIMWLSSSSSSWKIHFE